MKGWEYAYEKGSHKQWSKQLPDGRIIEVYYNTKAAALSLVDPPAKWEYIVYGHDGLEDVIDTFPDTCTTLAERLAYAHTVARMS